MLLQNIQLLFIVNGPDTSHCIGHFEGCGVLQLHHNPRPASKNQFQLTKKRHFLRNMQKSEIFEVRRSQHCPELFVGCMLLVCALRLQHHMPANSFDSYCYVPIFQCVYLGSAQQLACLTLSQHVQEQLQEQFEHSCVRPGI